jgi:hypothetical protein
MEVRVFTTCSFNPSTEHVNTAYVQTYCSELQIKKVLNIVLYKMRDILRYFIFENCVKCIILKSKIIGKIMTSQHNNLLKIVQFRTAVTVT